MNQLYKQNQPEIDKILTKYPPAYKRSAVMPLLFLAQREQGYISKEQINEIAEILEISSTEVASVVGFYTLFHEQPGGKYRIQVCTDLPCALRGSEEFFQQLCDYLGVQDGETTPDGLFTIESVKCIAACHKAPVFQLQGAGKLTYHENQSLETAKEIIEAIRVRNQEENSEKSEEA